mmetsp:Transcript_7746/g.12999  ORF Transcript_7746/g.12999 Transcript_7746/m.12999 type:complete len:260 (+) Transcript_7746:508-1287(+)
MAGGEEVQIPEPKVPEIRLDRFVPMLVRRQILRTLLMVMRDFNYCSIANQFCIMIFDQVKTLFDVIDVVQLQQFVIREFRERHQFLLDMHRENQQLNGNSEVFKRYKLNHLNMQSAQVNQMTSQLKDKIFQLQRFYSEENRERAVALTGQSVIYDDLITKEDKDFWQYLCKKDFRRLDKLMTQSIGEGHFIDDTDEDEESEEDSAAKEHKQGKPNNYNQSEDDERMDGDDDDYDHDKFIQSMLSNFAEGKDNKNERYRT